MKKVFIALIVIGFFACSKNVSKPTIQKSSIVNEAKKKPPCEENGHPCTQQ